KTSKPCSARTSVAEARPENATEWPAWAHARARGTIGFAWPSPPPNEKRTRNAGRLDRCGRRLLPHGVGEPLVRPQALERRRAELADLRHLQELDLADDLRLHPGRALHLRELRIGDRGGFAHEWPQELQHVRQHPVGE